MRRTLRVVETWADGQRPAEPLPISFEEIGPGNSVGESNWLLRFRNPGPWLAELTTTEEKIHRYVGFCQRWFPKLYHQTLVRFRPDASDAELLQFVFEAFANVDGSDLPFYLEKTAAGEAERDLRQILDFLAGGAA